MKNHIKRTGGPRGEAEPAGFVAVTPLRPALASIREACRYLGDLSRSRLYELLPNLDVVHIGARSFVTLDSLDRFIEAHRQGAVINGHDLRSVPEEAEGRDAKGRHGRRNLIQ